MVEGGGELASMHGGWRVEESKMVLMEGGGWRKKSGYYLRVEESENVPMESGGRGELHRSGGWRRVMRMR